MTVIQKTIGRLPVNLGDYDSTRSYGKKNRVTLYDCEWESKVDNNTHAPATIIGGVVTPDANWKLISGVPGNYGLDTKVANLQTALSAESERAQAAESAESTRAQAAESALSSGKADKATTLTGYGITDAYTKSETYTKTEVNGLVSTPHQEYVTVADYASLPASGSTDTIYRVSNYDGTQVATGVYSEYAWDGTQYVFLAAKSSVDEVFDISAYNNNAKYADLAAALNGGNNIPQSLQKGGMSVKFVQSSDNNYVQYRLMADSFTTDVTQWQGVDDEPTAGSDNLVKSAGVFSKCAESLITQSIDIRNVYNAKSQYCNIINNGNLEEISANYANLIDEYIDVTNISRIIFSDANDLAGYDFCFVAAFDASKNFVLSNSLHKLSTQASTLYSQLVWEKAQGTKYIKISYRDANKINVINETKKELYNITGLLIDKTQGRTTPINPLFTISEVSVGEKLLYSIDSYGSGYSYIELFDNNNNSLGYYGKAGSSYPADNYSGSFVVPEGFSYAKFFSSDSTYVIQYIKKEYNNQNLLKEIDEIKEQDKEREKVIYHSTSVPNYTVLFTKNNVDFNELIYYYLKPINSYAGFIGLYDSNNNLIELYGKSSSYYVEGAFEGTFSIPENFEYAQYNGYSEDGQICTILRASGNEFARINSNKNHNSRELLLGSISHSDNRLANFSMSNIDKWNTEHPSDIIDNSIIFDPSQNYFGDNWNKYRIPACCITNAGTYLVIAENRENGNDEDKMRCVLARKTSGGNWVRSILIPYDNVDGNRPINEAFCIDRTGANGVVGRIYLFYAYSHYGYLETQKSKCGYIYSDDDGVTWSAFNILYESGANDTYYKMGAVANGIQLSDGTIIMPAQYYLSTGNSSGLIIKKPNQGWYFSEPCALATNLSECTVYQRTNGDIVLDIRQETEPRRFVALYDIVNDEWCKEESTFEHYISCQKMIMKTTINSIPVYLMTFPDSKKPTGSAGTERQKTTLWVSYDSYRWIRCFRLTNSVNLGYCSMDCYDNKLIVAFENTTALDIKFADLTPLLSDFIISSTKTQINRCLEDKVQELYELIQDL